MHVNEANKAVPTTLCLRSHVQLLHFDDLHDPVVFVFPHLLGYVQNRNSSEQHTNAGVVNGEQLAPRTVVLAQPLHAPAYRPPHIDTHEESARPPQLVMQGIEESAKENPKYTIKDEK